MIEHVYDRMVSGAGSVFRARGAGRRLLGPIGGLIGCGVLLLFLVGCPANTQRASGNVGDDAGDAIKLTLSAQSPPPTQGQLVFIDYQGPAFDLADMTVVVGAAPVNSTYVASEKRINMMIPSRVSGQTRFDFGFGSGRNASLTLDVAAGQTVQDPRGTLAAGMARLAAGLSDSFADLRAELLALQPELSSLGDQELNALVLSYLALVEPNPGQSTISSLIGPQGTSDQSRAIPNDEASCQAALAHFVTRSAKARQTINLARNAMRSEARYLGTTRGRIVGRIVVSMVVTDVNSAHTAFRSAYTECVRISVSLPGSAGTRLVFEEDVARTFPITTLTSVLPPFRTEFVNTTSQFRTALADFLELLHHHSLSLLSRVRSICGDCIGWAQRILDDIPDPIEDEGTGTASDFVIGGISNLNVIGFTGTVPGDTSQLSLTFSVTVVDPPTAPAGSPIDFQFDLGSPSQRITPTTILARLNRAPPPTPTPVPTATPTSTPTATATATATPTATPTPTPTDPEQ